MDSRQVPRVPAHMEGLVSCAAVVIASVFLTSSSSWCREAHANPFFDAASGTYVSGDGGSLTLWRMQAGRVQEAATYALVLPSVIHPAHYEERTATVQVSPATVRREQIPAEYKDGKLITPASEREVPIPALYETRIAQFLVVPSRVDLQWDEAYVWRKSILAGPRPFRAPVDRFKFSAPAEPGGKACGGAACGAGGKACGK